MFRKNTRAFFRFNAFLLMIGGLYAIWLAGGFFVSDKLGWRKIIVQKWARTIAKIAMKIEVRGKSPTAPFFLVSNHLSYMDIAAYGAIVECFFVAKSEVADWFFIGKLAGTANTIFVNRRNRRDILRTAKEVSAKSKTAKV